MAVDLGELKFESIKIEGGHMSVEEKEEGREDEEDYFEETQGQDFATAYRANAKGSMWRYRRIIDTIRGQPLNVSAGRKRKKNAGC